MNQINKHKCFRCNNMAVWMYMPASNNLSEDERFYCDNCISRGCSCNAIWYEDDPVTEYYKDEFGRDLPCVEYDYCETGYNEDE